jgi:hypothetical protein
MLLALVSSAATGAVLGVDDPLTTPASAFFVNGRRPPGTLLLNILAKNEEVHLRRTLPEWAKLIDYWVIGLDEFNTDKSAAVIHSILGHIPGEIVTIYGFDGMGPSWSVLVDVGVANYPGATHGIISDADFAPMNPESYDKMGLDIRCSKHLFSIMTEDHLHKRKMDWIYRNVKGAKVTRRTHQVLEVPPLPEQITPPPGSSRPDMFITEAGGLTVDEREGGYQDRTGAVVKNLRYIGWLLKDLQEYPDDTRTLYYVAYAHFETFMKAKEASEARGVAITAAQWRTLAEAEMLFEKRVALQGNFEERYFAVMKLGEICDRFRRNTEGGIDKAVAWYAMAIALDSGRADALFYQGQLLRLVRRYAEAYAPLLAAAKLELPDRALFNWRSLYECYAHLELGRLLDALRGSEQRRVVADADVRDVTRSLARGAQGCAAYPSEHREIKRYQSAWTLAVQQRGKEQKKEVQQGGGAAAAKAKATAKAAAAAQKQALAAAAGTSGSRGGGSSTSFKRIPVGGLSEVPGNYGPRGSLAKFERPLSKFVKYLKAKPRLVALEKLLTPMKLYDPLVKHLKSLQQLLKAKFPRCRVYRMRTRAYARWVRAHEAELRASVAAMPEWLGLEEGLMHACR